MDHIGIDVHKNESQIAILTAEGELIEKATDPIAENGGAHRAHLSSKFARRTRSQRRYGSFPLALASCSVRKRWTPARPGTDRTRLL